MFHRVRASELNDIIGDHAKKPKVDNQPCALWRQIFRAGQVLEQGKPRLLKMETSPVLPNGRGGAMCPALRLVTSQIDYGT
jgi:hypothetical protein